MLFIFLFFIVAIIAIINPSLFASTNQNMASYGTDNFTPVNEPGTKAYKNEIAYYEKLEEISKKYFDKCGVVLDKYYIHNTLIYRYGNPENFYVEQEITEDSNKESEEVDYKDLAGKIETIADITAKIDDEDVTTYKVTYRLNALVKEGLAEKQEITVDKRKLMGYKAV